MDAECDTVSENRTLIEGKDDTNGVGDIVIDCKYTKLIVGETDGYEDGVIDIEGEGEELRLKIGVTVADAVIDIVRDGEVVDDRVVENDGITVIVGEYDNV